MTANRRIAILALASLWFLAGCGQVIVIQSQLYTGAPVYAPTDPQGVEILRSAPTGRHERLGEIYLEPKGTPSKAQILIRLKLAASRMGASAVVLVADKGGLTGGPVAEPQWWDPELKEGFEGFVVGVAIWHPH